MEYMTKYFCDSCNYITLRYPDLVRHQQSVKHKNNLRNSKIESDSSSDDSSSNEKNSRRSDKIKCKYCSKTFKFKSSMYKHQKYRCRSKDIDNDRIKTLEMQLTHALSIADNNSKTVKKSVSTMNYITKHFNDAPPVKLLDGNKLDGFIEYNGNTDKSIQQVMIHYFEKKKLHQLLGDLIIKEYKKEDPDIQSVWSSDVARLTFIVRQVVGDTKKNKWIVDKNGIDLTKLLIEPLVNKVIELLREYVVECHNYIKTANNSIDDIEIMEKLKYMQKANTVVMEIKLKILSTEILKYIAPHFNLGINKFDFDSIIQE